MTDESDVERDAGEQFAGLLSSLKASKRIRARKRITAPDVVPRSNKSTETQHKRKAPGDTAPPAKSAKGSTPAAVSPALNGVHAARLAAGSEAMPDTFAEHFDREAGPIQGAGGKPFALAFGASSQGGADSPVWAVQGEAPSSAPLELQAYGVKERLRRRWSDVHRMAASDAKSAAGDPADGVFASEEQAQLFALVNSYRDVSMPTRSYPEKVGASDPVMDAVLLHVLNHCTKAADGIKKHNEALKGGPKGADCPRDQGFSRCKVLILAPFRNAAAAIVQRLWRLAQAETRSDSVQHKDRFLDEFADEDPAEVTGSAARKPAEHRALFAGNCDDHFRLGIKLTRGAVRLYSDFAQSDIVVASPLGLATFLSEAAKSGDAGAADFLSSIEIAVVERADVLLMQNWTHVATVFEALNGLPRTQQGSDMMRVRPWYLEGQAPAFRQTVLFSSFAFPEMSALFSRRCSNWAGRALSRAQHQGVLSAVVPQLRQVFERVGGGGGAAPADARFEHFRSAMWPRLQSSGGSGQLVFVSSYFDFVRIRNFLQAESFDFVAASEYASHPEAARARSHFADGRTQLLLYTERSHFYHRPRLPGVKDVLFYQLPLHAHFYSELVNAIGSGDAAQHATVTALFAPEDAGALERVVGSTRAKKMLRNVDTPTFMFC